jgi:hypothetical protein
MMRRAPALAALALLALAGCSRSATSRQVVARTYAEPDASRAAGAVAAREQVGAYVWVREGDKTATYTVSEEGEVLSSTEGIALMTSRGVARLRTTTVPVKRSPCAWDADGNELPKDKQARPATKATFVSMLAPEGGVVPVGSDGSGELIDRTTTSEVLGSVGPYLFVRETVTNDFCGNSYDDRGAQVIVRDLEGNVATRIDPTEDEAKKLRAAADRALRARPNVELYDEPEITATTIRFTGDKLAVSYQVSAVTCHGCGDKAYSAYTHSVDLPAPALPKELEPYASAPKAVSAFLAANPGKKLGGYSRPPRGPRA